MIDNLWYMQAMSFDKMVASMHSVTVNAETLLGRGHDEAKLSKLENVAIMQIGGPLFKSENLFTRILGFVHYEEIAGVLNDVLNDSSIDTLVLAMDTPGGQTAGLSELSEKLDAFASQKRLIVQVEGLLASAGYYIAAHAHKIYAKRMDLVGSIGVRMMVYDFSEMFAKEGIRAIPIDTGQYKSAGARGTEVTEAQQAEFQRIVDHYFDDFLTSVAHGRRMDRKDLALLADGRIFFATEAVIDGLIDGVQGLELTLSDYVNQKQASNPSLNRYKNLRSSSGALMAV